MEAPVAARDERREHVHGKRARIVDAAQGIACGEHEKRAHERSAKKCRGCREAGEHARQAPRAAGGDRHPGTDDERREQGKYEVVVVAEEDEQQRERSDDAPPGRRLIHHPPPGKEEEGDPFEGHQLQVTFGVREVKAAEGEDVAGEHAPRDAPGEVER